MVTVCIGGCGPKDTDAARSHVVTAKKYAVPIPAGYTVYEEIKGDLNKDGLDDMVLIIDGNSDGSNSGIIIAFNMGERYEVALENSGCFSSENVEFGKCGSPGRMGVSIKKGVLVIDYGGWCVGTYPRETYKFRYGNIGFELIGYDNVAEEDIWGEEHPVILRVTSVNLLSKKMQTKTNKAAKAGDEVFDEVWNDITVKEPITLRNIGTLYDYNVMAHITEIVDINQPEPEKPDIFTDTRDGQKYRIVQAGNQVWTAENLNYKMGRSWCYNDSGFYCKKYGRLYSWYTAKEVCPAGWHLPSSDEWRELIEYIGGPDGAGTRLKATGGWHDYGGMSGNGTDDFGFSALPGGNRYNDDGSFNDAGSSGIWWVTTASGAGGMSRWNMSNGDEYVSNSGADRSDGYSVRCVKDESTD
jgi:uncharacterized protein (TIGR02145 family)